MLARTHHVAAAAHEAPITPTITLEVIDSKAAAILLQVHVTTVQELARRGEIPCRKVGKDYRFLRPAILAWLQGTTAQAVRRGRQCGR